MARKLVTGEPQKQIKGKENPGGAPTMFELDPDIINRVEAALRMGCPVTTAFSINNVSYSTLRNWVINGTKDPSSEHGVLLQRVQKAISEWEVRDISVLEAHAHGKPAEYQMEPAKDSAGNFLFDETGKPIMQVARDSKGDPILLRSEIKSDWRAAAHRLERRRPGIWARMEAKQPMRTVNRAEEVLDVDPSQIQEEPTGEVVSFKDQVAQAMKELDDEY